MNPMQILASELEQESKATRRLLELVPNDRLGWKPHEKSMTLGQLALHIAGIPARISNMMLGDGFDTKKASFAPPMPSSASEILTTFEHGLEEAKKIMAGFSAEQSLAPWKLTSGEKELWTLPRVGVARGMLLNHWYHHRGQLTVYLRLLDVPLPVTYGRSADTNPFG